MHHKILVNSTVAVFLTHTHIPFACTHPYSNMLLRARSCTRSDTGPFMSHQHMHWCPRPRTRRFATALTALPRRFATALTALTTTRATLAAFSSSATNGHVVTIANNWVLSFLRNISCRRGDAAIWDVIPRPSHIELD
jgi:hypothetical protein